MDILFSILMYLGVLLSPADFTDSVAADYQDQINQVMDNPDMYEDAMKFGWDDNEDIHD